MISHYFTKRAQGLCGYGKCQIKSEMAYCPEHHEKLNGNAAERERKRAAVRRAQGLCAYAGCRNKSDHYYCLKHAKEHNAQTRALQKVKDAARKVRTAERKAKRAARLAAYPLMKKYKIPVP